MATVSITDLKARLSEHLRSVRGGNRLVVTDRGRPVAVITPVTEFEKEIAGLVRDGVLTPPEQALDERFWELDRPADPDGRVRALLQTERDDGR